MSINLKNIGLISLFFISPKQKVQIKSGQSTNLFYAGEPLGDIFRVNFTLDKSIKIVYML